MLEYLSGRVSEAKHTVKELPSNIIRSEICNDYIAQFLDLIQAAILRLHCIVDENYVLHLRQFGTGTKGDLGCAL